MFVKLSQINIYYDIFLKCNLKMNYDFIIQKLNEYIIYLKYKQSKLKEEYFNFFK